MKKIGVLFGKERSFPEAFIERVNSKNIDGIIAEPVRIDKVMQGEPSGYAVIFDRISQDVPFYRAFLKNAALCGTTVINNPFWWSADEKFFNNCLATKIDVPVPKTVILPSRDLPPRHQHVYRGHASASGGCQSNGIDDSFRLCNLCFMVRKDIIFSTSMNIERIP